ncbi:MAG: hypothetical protein COV46_05730 [Deltaproteobacteria bacterium CG11_big_fil_rev_8_21_14_0_20_49_13]|nr:MAG: hypothetical protein COV46_05730 [Deltaproteobacteria bacterium CG11_big_fil_rev_8_21_14_0_20_49_13]
MKKQIIKLCVLILFPLIVSAGYSGGGSGCMGCGGGGGGGDDAAVITGGDGPAIDTGGVIIGGVGVGGSDTPLATAGVSKDVLGMMPDMDSIVLIKMDELFKNPLVGNILGEMSVSADDPGTPKGVVGKSLDFAAKEALSPDMKGVFILAVKFSWPKTFDDNKKVQVKEFMGLMIGGESGYMSLQNKLKEKLAENLISAGKKINDIEFNEIEGPSLCDKDKTSDCGSSSVFYGMMPDKKTFIISTQGAAEEFTAKYLAQEAGSLNTAPKSLSKAAAANTGIKQYLASVNCGVACGVITTPLAAIIKDAVSKKDSKFMEEFGAIWKNMDILPKAGAVAVGIDMGERYGIEGKAFILDAVKDTASFSLSFDKTLIENLNFKNIFMVGKTAVQDMRAYDNKCHGAVVRKNCGELTSKEECETSYYLWPTKRGGTSPHNCMWNENGSIDDRNVTSYCYANGGTAEEGVCELAENNIEATASYGVEELVISGSSSGCMGSWNMDVTLAGNDPYAKQITMSPGESLTFDVSVSGNDGYSNAPISLSLTTQGNPPNPGGFVLTPVDEVSLLTQGPLSKQVQLTAQEGTPYGTYLVIFKGTVSPPYACQTLENHSDFDVTVEAGGN